MKIHFIGICGVAMSALAIAFKKVNWKVTGSDAGFFPPVSTNLEKNQVDFYPGWHPDMMIKDGVPDLVVVGNVASSTNPEWLYVMEHNLSYLSYPELIAKYLLSPNSIVCAGTYGKTTSAALMTWILKENGYNPNYMFGGVALNDMDSAFLPAHPSASPPARHLPSYEGRIISPPYTRGSGRERDVSGRGGGEWSVLEGDEYKTGRSDPRPKFVHYSPTHLLLTSVVWDHADVYPTEESYVQAFQNLYDLVPSDGVRVISEKAIKVIDTKEKPVVSYGADKANEYQLANVRQSKIGVAFDIVHDGKTYHLQTQTLGAFMADNITGCFALAHQIGLKPDDIIQSVAGFLGTRRRLEKRYAGKITVFDDIAHSPSKAEAILNSLRTVYEGKIVAVFEPNTGNREKQSAPGYDNAFAAANEVIIPRLTKIKISPGDGERSVDGPDLKKIIEKTHPRVYCIEDDETLILHLLNTTKKDDVVVFLGSHGFRGMIETLIAQLQLP